jgi:hypothetical protein
MEVERLVRLISCAYGRLEAVVAGLPPEVVEGSGAASPAAAFRDASQELVATGRPSGQRPATESTKSSGRPHTSVGHRAAAQLARSSRQVRRVFVVVATCGLSPALHSEAPAAGRVHVDGTPVGMG